MAGTIVAKNATATGTLLDGRCRLKSLIVKTATTGNPKIVVRDGGASGNILLTIEFTTSDDRQVSIPDHGILFETDCHVTLTAVSSITGFFG